MMEVLLGLALKSLLIAGITLVVLQLTRSRSASERSLIAHLGLVALVALPIASLMLPSLNVALPDALRPAPAIEQVSQPADPVTSDQALVTAPDFKATELAAAPAMVAEAADTTPSFDWTPYAYAAPAVALLLITIVALLRLVALRSRAQILVDPTWLTALAHAQRRMGFKNGTALLTSNELSSPISWGLMRPVILLNEEALDATGEAEAIIAHELAHVARLDWAKLMLARIATAIFWFNPLAWVLAREAHQLREEAADDAVLAANIDGADYAQLLVGVARHECKGLLLGAHGVAPGKGSLRRRVGRVLDGTLARSPATKSWVAGFGAGMLVMAAPLAALTLGPKAQDKLDAKMIDESSRGPATPISSAYPDGVVSSAVLSAVAGATGTGWDDELRRDLEKNLESGEDFVTRAPSGASVVRKNGIIVTRAPSGASVTVYPPDAKGRRKIVSIAPGGATAIAYADARDDFLRAKHKQRESVAEQVIAMRAVGVTPEYVDAIRQAAPQLGAVDSDDLVELRAVGVTPEYIRELAAAGFRNLDKDALVEARAVGVTGNYIRSMKAAGIRGTMDDYVELRAVGVNARDARRGLSADDLVNIKVGHIDPFDENPPEPPAPPEVGDPDPDPDE
ncbi:MAG TPA: M56 family metallopeptidase [Sphingomicrobium sp.]|nr:M56 family metallopeptidase [Sphingomicrobium sp.]